MLEKHCPSFFHSYFKDDLPKKSLERKCFYVKNQCNPTVICSENLGHTITNTSSFLPIFSLTSLALRPILFINCHVCLSVCCPFSLANTLPSNQLHTVVVKHFFRMYWKKIKLFYFIDKQENGLTFSDPGFTCSNFLLIVS